MAGVASPASTTLSLACLLGVAHLAVAQQSVVPPDLFQPLPPIPEITADGMLLAQSQPIVEQARLHERTQPAAQTGVNADGMALPEPEATPAPADDSFGDQKILKTQERLRSFVVTGGASVFYTNNVALTRSNERDDVFAVVDAGIGWSPRLSQSVEANVSFGASLFRYDQTPELDFENLGFSVGLSYTPQNAWGINVFARYNFTELLNRSGDEILMDHALTAGVQKGISFGRAHGLIIGAVGTADISNPGVSQRQQLALFVSYHLQLSRNLYADILYRPTVHFYTDAGRTDFNQVLSLGMRYRLTDWAEAHASFSYGSNRSDRSVFDYDVLTTGFGLGVNIRF